MIDYAGKVVLVTGGASGIGLALAHAFQQRGARIVIADVAQQNLEAAARELGNQCVPLVCDLSKPEQQVGLVERAHGVWGRLDVVCSNAGLGRNKRVLREIFDEAAMQMFEVNFHAGIRIAQAYQALLVRENTKGHIMFTASENALSVPSAVRGSGLGFYGAAKHGLLIMAEWLRDEVADGPLSVHVLLPGAVYTPLIARKLPDPKEAPPALDLIMPDRCAEIALKGLDLGLFYIPTQRHLAQDMRARTQGVADAVAALGLG